VRGEDFQSAVHLGYSLQGIWGLGYLVIWGEFGIFFVGRIQAWVPGVLFPVLFGMLVSGGVVVPAVS
jgi:hypothetical protein